MTRYAFLYSMIALLPLAACETNPQDAEAIKGQVKQDAEVLQTRATQSGVRVANDLRDNIKNTSMMMRKWWLTLPAPPTPTPVPPSYCYQVFQDIVCYRDPMPGQTHKLVGYQGENTAPPPVAQTTTLPMSPIQKLNPGATAAARVEHSKPIFVGIPTTPKESKIVKGENGELPAGSEPLPDPSLSPQL